MQLMSWISNYQSFHAPFCCPWGLDYLTLCLDGWGGERSIGKGMVLSGYIYWIHENEIPSPSKRWDSMLFLKITFKLYYFAKYILGLIIHLVLSSYVTRWSITLYPLRSLRYFILVLVHLSLYKKRSMLLIVLWIYGKWWRGKRKVCSCGNEIPLHGCNTTFFLQLFLLF
jgi:hypothetical protein